MLTSKLELLVDFGNNPDQKLVDKTLSDLKSRDGIANATFKDGAIVVETTLPSSIVVDLTSRAAGRRTVLQGFGASQSAVAMVSSQSCCHGNVMGVVRFQQTDQGPLIVEGTVDGLTGAHGLRVHESGDLSEGCSSIGSIYDPPRSQATSVNTQGRKAGDLGDIKGDFTGRAQFRIIDEVLKISDLIGRSVAITSSKESSTDTNGQNIACGVIARSAGVFQNPKRICACDGVVVWDERDRPLAGKGRRERPACCKRETENGQGDGARQHQCGSHL